MGKPCNIAKCFRSVIIEHINGDTLDNRKENLRVVGYLPLKNHAFCKRTCGEHPSFEDAPVLTKKDIEAIKAEGRTIDDKFCRNSSQVTMQWVIMKGTSGCSRLAARPSAPQRHTTEQPKQHQVAGVGTGTVAPASVQTPLDLLQLLLHDRERYPMSR